MPRMLPAITFWLCSALLAWVYLGYPLLVGLVARVRPMRLELRDPPPTLTVAIAVHNGEAEIADRIADVIAQSDASTHITQILVGSDGSTDGTDAIVTTIAATDPRIVLLSLPREGQSATQNALLGAASGDVIVLTDVETRYQPGCIHALAETFRDPRVGCATGRLEWRGERSTVTSADEGLYWRYERRLRDLESRGGFLAAVTGALLAARRRSAHPVPPSASMDQLIPLYMRQQGMAVVYVPDAVATDRPISGTREQFESRARTATQGIRANLAMVGRLTPWHQPRAFLSIWSHKLARWATPWLILGAAGSGLALAATGSTTYGIVPAATVLGLGGAAGAQAIASRGRRPPRLLAMCRSFAIVNIAFALAWINLIRGRRFETWTTRRSGEQGTVALASGTDSRRGDTIS